MSVDAALSLGRFIKLLVTFEFDGGEEVRLGGGLLDVQSLPSTCTDTALSSPAFLSSPIFYFSSDAVTCSLLELIYSFATGYYFKKNSFGKSVYITPMFCNYIFLLSVNVLCFSQVHIGYLPNKRVLGLSKLAR